MWKSMWKSVWRSKHKKKVSFLFSNEKKKTKEKVYKKKIKEKEVTSFSYLSKKNPIKSSLSIARTRKGRLRRGCGRSPLGRSPRQRTKAPPSSLAKILNACQGPGAIYPSPGKGARVNIKGSGTLTSKPWVHRAKIKGVDLILIYKGSIYMGKGI